jgi:hypothetical protein
MGPVTSPMQVDPVMAQATLPAGAVAPPAVDPSVMPVPPVQPATWYSPLTGKEQPPPPPSGPVTAPSGLVTSPSQADAGAADNEGRQAPKDFLAHLTGMAQQANDPVAQYAKQGQAALGEQKQVAQQRGDMESQKAQEDYQTLLQRNKDVDTARADAEKQAAQRQAEEAKRQADIDGMVDRFATMKVDPNRYWNDKSTAGKIGSAIGVMFSGLGSQLQQGYSGRAGGNPFLDSIKDSIKQDVAAQTADQEKYKQLMGMKRDSLSHYHAQTQDMAQAAQLKVAEGYKRAADMIEATGQKYASPEAQLKAKEAAAKLDADAAGLTKEVGKWAQDRSDKQFEQGIQKQQVGIAAGHLAEQRREFDLGRVDKINEQLLAQAAQQQGLNKAQADELVNRGVASPDGGSLMNANNEPYLAPKGRETEIQKASTAQATLMASLDRLRQLRDANGGHIVNNADSRKAAQNMARALVAMHEAKGITRFSGEVVELMDKQIAGGADINSVMRSLMPNLDEARTNAIEDYNATLTGANYKGKLVDFPDPLKNAAPAPGKMQRGAQGALEYNAAAPSDDEAAELGTSDNPLENAAGGLPSNRVLGSIFNSGATAAATKALNQSSGIPAEHKASVDMLVKTISDKNSDPKQREDAAALLDQIVHSGNDKTIRDYARSKWMGAIGESIPVSAP